jgi:5'(3')-deoxyribonucleotidase
MKLLELVEAEQSIRFTFGRFNPPHIGHKKLLDAVGKGYIFPSHTHDSKKNPLMPKEKVGFMRSMFPQYAGNIVYKENATNIIDIMKLLQKNGHKNVTMVVGSDRVDSFDKLLKTYNGKEYRFDTITVESAGVRDPDADGVEGASASKVRQAATNNDFETFKSMIPGGNNLAKAIFQATREGLKLNELNEQQTKPIVFLDMDGVLADFFTEYAKKAGVKDGNYRKIPRDKINPTLNSMVGTDFFNTLPKIATADRLTEIVVNYTGGDYSILSSPLRGDKDNSARWKKVWLAREMKIQPRNVIITSNKSAYAKSNGIANILIDDHGSNIQKWNAAGGHGIKYQADEDSLQTVTKGLKAYENDRLDKRGN